MIRAFEVRERKTFCREDKASTPLCWTNRELSYAVSA